MKLINNLDLVRYCEKKYSIQNGGFLLKLFGVVLNFYLFYEIDINCLSVLLKYLVDQNFSLFDKLYIKHEDFASNNFNIEKMFNELIVKFSFRLKLIEVLYLNSFHHILRRFFTLDTHTNLYGKWDLKLNKVLGAISVNS